ncbi:glycoside hydrolase family 3 C-terminal domain-containing protein [Oerskovia sp. M15]
MTRDDLRHAVGARRPRRGSGVLRRGELRDGRSQPVQRRPERPARSDDPVRLDPPEGVIANPTIDEAVEAAAAADTAIVVARDYTGEAADRGTLTLPEDQDALIEAVSEVNDNTIVVLATSGPVTMPWLDDVEATLEVWYPGQTQGESVAGVLFGDVTPPGSCPSRSRSTRRSSRRSASRIRSSRSPR